MEKQLPPYFTDWLKESGIQEKYHDKPQNRLVPKARLDDPLTAKKVSVESGIQLSPKSVPSLQNVENNIEATTIEELRTLVENFEGCSLKKTAMHTVFSDGNPKAKVMLIGEAPGAEEDKQGKPFVGQSGKLLRLILSHIGLTSDHIYISNVIYWRPPGNRPPTPQEITTCLPFLQKHIELIQPSIIILAGATAVKAILNTNEGITKIHGKWFSYTSKDLANPIPTMPLFHPAFLLRSPGKKKDVWYDMLKIKQKLGDL